MILSGYASLILIQFISGFYFFGLVALFTSNYVNQSKLLVYGENKDIITAIAILLLGLIGGLVAFKFDNLGIFALGTLFGFVIACILLQLQPIASILVQKLVRLAVMAFISIIFGFTPLRKP